MPGAARSPAAPARAAVRGCVVMALRRWWDGARARWLTERGERERRAGRYALAERLARRGLGLLGGVGARNAPLELRLLNELGMACKYQGRFHDSARAYLRALRLVRRRFPGDELRLATLYHNVGGLEHARGRHARGERFARRALALRERTLGTEHVDVARDAAALAGLLDGLRRHFEAEALHRRVLALFERRLGRNHVEVGYVLENLAACLHASGQTGAALPLARRATEIFRTRLGAEHPDARHAAANLLVIEGAARLAVVVPGR